uniref:Uncharacterized protein n=1 Tax=Leersia perrieri TaxID=77586 RepID=A0A0D9WD52_9ORYZ
MSRYDDRYDRPGHSTKLYVGCLSERTRTEDLEYLFGKYGRVRDVNLKNDYGFVEFSDHRDANDARLDLDGREFDGSYIIVQFAKGEKRGPGGSREYTARGPHASDHCFNCGMEGHWERDCTAGDWKDRCYRCGERGHIMRDCKNSPKDLKQERGYSRSPLPRHRRSPSYGKSGPLSQWACYGADREERLYYDRSYSRSPRRYGSSSNRRNHSPRRYGSPSNRRNHSPRRYGSPSNRRNHSPRRYGSPFNERNHSSRRYASPSNERNNGSRRYASPPNGRDRNHRGNASPPNGRNHNLTSNGINPPSRGRDDQNGSHRRRDSDYLAHNTRASPTINGRNPSPWDR